MEKKLWVFKTVEDADRASRSVDNYNDELSSKYNYDSNVKNYKNIKIGDKIILIDKKKILGFAQIENIDISNGKKTIRRCPNPDCRSTNIEQRKTLKPLYRCNRGHVFDFPTETVMDVRKFTAYYPNNFKPIGTDNSSLHQLKPYYTNGYNRNNSIQLLSEQVLNLFDPSVQLVSADIRPLANEGKPKGNNSDNYQSNNIDERSSVYRQIKERRGQQKFRTDLFERYGVICMMTGCGIKDILEAAHINPYRGINDNHLDNGLILRADIHTLFDLDLIGIDPQTLAVHCHPKIVDEYGNIHKKQLLYRDNSKPSMEALSTRWKIFNNNRSQ
jgi:putative restriction endonuclease